MKKLPLATVLITLLTAPHVRAESEFRIASEQFATLGVTLQHPRPTDQVASERLPAQVVVPPVQEQVVAAPQDGLLERLNAAEGDAIQAGEVLAVLRSPALIALERDFLQALTRETLVRSERQRDEQLFKEGIIAERRYQETRSRHRAAQAELAERRQALQLAGLDEAALEGLARTREISDRIEITAPMNGYVMDRRVMVGSRVTIAEPLYRLASLDTLWLELRAPLETVTATKPGDPVESVAPASTARIILIGREVEPQTQTVLVRAEVEKGAEALRPGQYLEVRIAGASAAVGFAVPAGAVVRAGEASFIFVRTADGFQVRPVQVAGQSDGEAVVAGALSAGEEIAVTGIAALKAAWQGLGGGE